MTTSSTRASDTAAVPGTPSVRSDRLIGAGVLIAGIAVVTAASQLHHHFAPHEAGGWRELPIYTISGVIGWLVAFGIAYVRPHRAAAPAGASRRVGVGLAAVGLPAAALLWWTPIPFCLGAAATLLIRRARDLGTTSRWDAPTRVLAAVDIALPVVVLAFRIVASAR
jgi:hypothetical protein